MRQCRVLQARRAGIRLRLGSAGTRHTCILFACHGEMQWSRTRRAQQGARLAARRRRPLFFVRCLCSYHILTRASERFTFAAGKKLHIAKQCFTTDVIRHFTSSNLGMHRSFTGSVRIAGCSASWNIFTSHVSSSSSVKSSLPVLALRSYIG